MAYIQVTKFHPVQIGASATTPTVVKNVAGGTLSYKIGDPGVSSSLRDGTITVGSEETFYVDVWLITTEEGETTVRYLPASPKQVIDGEVATANIQALAVTEAKLAALAVSEAKLAAEAVTAGKIGSEAVTTAKLAAGAVTEAKLGALSVVGSKVVVPTIKLPSGEVEGEFGIPAFVPSLRACWVTYVSEASATTKEIPHQLATEQFAVAAAYNFKKTGKATGAGVTSIGIKEWTSVSTTKVTIVLNAAPAAKDVLAFLFVG